MSNLGRYAEFSADAKAAGGVDELIALIEKAAVSRSATSTVAKSAVAAFLVIGAVEGGRVLLEKHKERQQAAQAAKDELRARFAAGRSTITDTSQGENDAASPA